MLDYIVSTSARHTNDTWWQQERFRLVILYSIVALILLGISIVGHIRLLNEVGHTFGGFFWANDTDGRLVIVSTPAQLSPLGAPAHSPTSSTYIVKANQISLHHGSDLTSLYQTHQSKNAQGTITYTIETNNIQTTLVRPVTTFTTDIWWQNYGLGLLAGICWLLVGGILLMRAPDWTGAVEGMTLLPPAILLLLYSHWGNVQKNSPTDLVFQLLWIPAFALLGAAFIHLSLIYRPEALSRARRPSLMIDGLPYLPLIALVAYEWSSVLLIHRLPISFNLAVSLGYAAIAGLISLGIGLRSLVGIGRIGGFLPVKHGQAQQHADMAPTIPAPIRKRIGDLLTLWIGGVGLVFCLWVLPVVFTGQTLLPLPTFYMLAAIYPLALLYAIHSLRLLDRLHVTLDQREEELRRQQKTEEAQQQSNADLKHTTSLLLHADAHLRSLLSQRIHDQPMQQALRIRSLLGHWQHKLRIEAERDPEGKVVVKPISEALGKVRKISEELEDDLRGLQLLVEDAYQRRNLGLKLHLEKLIREDLPALYPESSLKIQADLWAIDALSPDLEQTDEGAKIAEAISYTVTQALLNIYNHAGASYALVRTIRTGRTLEIYIIDDGRGFDPRNVPPEKTSLFKAQLKAREAGGAITIESTLRPEPRHGTIIKLRMPLPHTEQQTSADPALDYRLPATSDINSNEMYRS
jgi:hypothetical protein